LRLLRTVLNLVYRVSYGPNVRRNSRRSMLHLLLCLGVGQCAEYRRVCYYTNWAQYRPSFGKFQPRNIPLHLCSHLVYAFASMSGNRLRPFEWNDETVPWMRGMYVGQLSLLSLTVPALLAYWLRLRPAVVTYVG